MTVAPTVLRLLLQAAIAIALAAGALAAFLGAVAAVAGWRAGGLGDFQWIVWTQLLRGIFVEALVPHILLSALLWLLTSGLRRGAAGPTSGEVARLLVVVALAFVPVGMFGFGMWAPRGPVDVVWTWLLVSAGTASALLIAGRLLRLVGPAGERAGGVP